MPEDIQIEKRETPDEEAQRLEVEGELKRKIEEVQDELERANTGLPNAAPLVQGIKSAAQKVHRPTIQEEWGRMTPAQQEIVAREELAKYEAPLRPKDAPKSLRPATFMPDIPTISPDRPHVPGPVRQVQIDEVMSLKIELLMQKMAVLQRDEQLAKIALQDVQRSKTSLAAERKKLMAELSEQVGFEVRGDVRLLDREKRLIAVEG